jgi:hypothetical protein
MGWTGKIVDRPSYWTWKEPKGDAVVYVDWQERRAMMENTGDRGDRAIKDPVVSARVEDLTLA